MWLLFAGFAASLAFGVCGATLLSLVSGQPQAEEFLVMYLGPFNTFIALGIIAGAALIVGFYQKIIPDTIESAFTKSELASTDYLANKQKFYSLRRTLTFGSEFMAMGFIILSLCGFPLARLGEAVMILAGCAQWALASYVGRKLRYAAMMVYSLLEAPINRNLFKGHSLDIINTAVNVSSTLTIIFVYVHVHSYYNGPFAYDSFLGSSAQVFLLLPAILAAPVLLIFNFFPRQVLRKVYDKSIDVEVQSLHDLLKSERLTSFEKRLHLLRLAKMYKEELRYSLQLTLSDLPIGVTILLMVAETIINR